jgi:hypothetical protein
MQRLPSYLAVSICLACLALAFAQLDVPKGRVTLLKDMLAAQHRSARAQPANDRFEDDKYAGTVIESECFRTTRFSNCQSLCSACEPFNTQ